MSEALKERQESRQADFKRGIDGDDARRGRDEGLMSIRKNKREDKLAKRRQQQAPATPGGSAAPAPVFTQQQREGNDMQDWIAKLQGQTLEEVFAATQHFRKLLSLEKNPPIQRVIDAGVVPQLVHLCKAEPHPKLQYEAAWALTNIASGSSAQTAAVIAAGAVPVFATLLRSADETVREQAIWALGNIAGDSPSNRDAVLQAGALPALLLNLQHTSKLSMLRNGTWTLSNMVRGKPAPPLELVAPAMPALAHLLQSSDTEVLTDACWAISYLSDGSGERLQAVADGNVVGRLTELLKHSNASIQTPALRTIGNLATGSDTQTDSVVQAGAVPHLVALLGSQRKGVRKEAMWTLSNITAGTKAQIQTVVDAGGASEIVRQLKDGEWEIKKEAAWTASNFLSGGTHEQVRHLISKGIVKPLCDLLAGKDAKILLVALEALSHILRAGQSDGGKFGASKNAYADMIEDSDGLDRIEELQEHPNEKVYEKAVDLIEKYFAEDDGEAENFGAQGFAQGQGNGQFAFGASFNSPAPAMNNSGFGMSPAQPQQQGGFSFAAPVGGGGFNF